jgi:hypothetical protein
MDDDPARAALAYQRMSKEKRDRTIWAKTAQEAISVLEDKAYIENLTEVHLDHDLAGHYYQNPTDENCGMEVVRFLEKMDVNTISHIKFTVHTHNYFGGYKMRDRLDKAGLNVKFIPFGLENEVL